MKSKSYFLLFLLALVLIFILGVRYGQRVEQTNKAINYLLSITPTPPAGGQAKLPLLEFKKYTQKVCGVEFLYPGTLELKSEATASALFIQKDASLEIHCDKNNKLTEVLKDQSIATAEVTFKTRKIQGKATNQDNIYVFSFLNPIKGTAIFIAISKTLYPLFESTLQFNP